MTEPTDIEALIGELEPKIETIPQEWWRSRVSRLIAETIRLAAEVARLREGNDGLE